MVTEIKRVRFFDGQFLKELEFREEQLYHQHLRRRMNFFLFEPSGVVELEPDDLKFFDINNADKTFRVRAGMAICRRPDLAEGKEIILFTDSPTIDLDTEGIVAGNTAFVTIHWEEEEAKDPASEGDVDENTRVKEKAVLKVHSSMPVGPAPNGEEYILLGTMIYNDMTLPPDYTVRHVAKLRNSLLAGSVVLPPTITSISPTTIAANGAATPGFVITGTNLTGAAVSFPSEPMMSVGSTVSGGGGMTLTVTLTAQPGTTPGNKSFRVTNAAGFVDSPVGVFLTVTAPLALPTITSISVHSVARLTSTNAVINGTNLSGGTVAFSGSGVSVVPNGPPTANTIPITINVSNSAPTGSRTFTVTTTAGSVTSNNGVVAQSFTVTL